jgi:hypothetical protein
MVEKEIDHEKRRTLGTIAKGLFAGVGALFLGNETVKTIEQKVRTPVGDFFPHYERHQDHETVQDAITFPKPCHGFAPEFVLNDEIPLMDIDGLKLVLTSVTGYDSNTLPNFYLITEKTIAQLASAQIPVVFGDIALPTGTLPSWKETLVEARHDMIVVGQSILGVLAVLDLKHVADTEKMSELKTLVTRRKFLKGSLGLGIGALTAANKHQEMADWLGAGLASEDATTRRLYSRVAGTISELRPEFVSDFFRNLLVANKLLFYAETCTEQGIATPNIVTQYHGGHSEIEVYLQLGRTFCRNMIAHFPPQFLQEVIARNGGLEKFCSVRSITFEKNFTLQSREIVRQNDGSSISNSIVDGNLAADLIVTDDELVKTLSEISFSL